MLLFSTCIVYIYFLRSLFPVLPEHKGSLDFKKKKKRQSVISIIFSKGLWVNWIVCISYHVLLYVQY